MASGVLTDPSSAVGFDSRGAGSGSGGGGDLAALDMHLGEKAQARVAGAPWEVFPSSLSTYLATSRSAADGEMVRPNSPGSR